MKVWTVKSSERMELNASVMLVFPLPDLSPVIRKLFIMSYAPDYIPEFARDDLPYSECFRVEVDLYNNMIVAELL